MQKWLAKATARAVAAEKRAAESAQRAAWEEQPASQLESELEAITLSSRRRRWRSSVRSRR